MRVVLFYYYYYYYYSAASASSATKPFYRFSRLAQILLPRSLYLADPEMTESKTKISRKKGGGSGFVALIGTTYQTTSLPSFLLFYFTSLHFTRAVPF